MTTNSKHSLPEYPEYTDDFADVYKAELNYIEKRREQTFKIQAQNEVPNQKVTPSTKAGLVGLALSGGGVRSATFNLGLLQSLAKNNILQYCDYLSTVSGGGYIGSCMTSLLAKEKTSTEPNEFPLRNQHDGKEEQQEVNYLRQNKNYLDFGNGIFSLSTWQTLGTILTGLMLMMTIPLAILLGTVLGLWYFELEIPSFQDILTVTAIGLLWIMLIHLRQVSVFWEWALMLIIPSAVLFLTIIIYQYGFHVVSLFFVLLSVIVLWKTIKRISEIRSFGYDSYKVRRHHDKRIGWRLAILSGLVTAILLGYFIYHLAYKNLTNNDIHIILVIMFVSIAAILILMTRRFLNLFPEAQEKLTSIVVSIALVMIFSAVFALLLAYLNEIKDNDLKDLIAQSIIGVIVILLIIGFFTNLNYNSLHYFYRSRLSKTYLKQAKKEGDEHDYESLLLKNIHEYHNGPYHIINTTLNAPSSKDPSLSGRGADFFIFSKYYCGAESTGYRRTEYYDDGKTKLATAMAISGAAASPAMGTSTNSGMAALMTLMNIRLNLWMLNPKLKQKPKITIWPYYLSKELLCKGSQDDCLLNLSDGGHHENLGIYPLLKRKCKIIIASDAGADPNYQMEDLANLQRKARIDLGINIDIDLIDLRPDDKTGYTKAYFAKGTIHYPGEEETGTLFYIKTTMTGNEPEDLLGYQRKNPDFPDETTADQFFNEDQFESYRKLGEWIGEKFYLENLLKYKTAKETGLDIFAIYDLFSDSKTWKPIVQSLKIGDLENLIIKMDMPLTFYPQREDESSIGEEFSSLVEKFVKENRSQLIKIIRDWLEEKSHQHLLWFASDIIGYFKLSELRHDLLPFCQLIMKDPDQCWSGWELNCLWAYARLNDYKQINELLQTSSNAETQKWLLGVYTQMVTTHPEEGKHQCFIEEVQKFLQGSGIKHDVLIEAQKVLKELENLKK